MYIVLSNLRGVAFAIPRTPCNIVPALIGAGAALAGSFINAQSTSANNAENRSWQSQENQRNRNWQEYMTKKYTSVEGQVSSAQRAGLNPNNLFDSGVSGSAAAPNSTAAPETSAPQPGSGLMQIAPYLAQMKLTDAQANKASAEANNIDSKTPLEIANLQNEVAKGNPLAKLAWENTQLDLSNKRADLEFKLASTQTQRAMSDKFMMESAMIKYDLKELKPLEKQQIAQGITESIARVHLLNEQGKLTMAETKRALAETYKAYMDAVSNRISANAATMQGQAALQNADTNQLVGRSQADLNSSLSVESQTRSVGQQTENSTKVATQRYVIKQMETSLKVLEKQNNWTNAKEFAAVIRDIGVGLGSAFSGAANTVNSFGAMSY